MKTAVTVEEDEAKTIAVIKVHLREEGNLNFIFIENRWSFHRNFLFFHMILRFFCDAHVM